MADVKYQRMDPHHVVMSVKPNGKIVNDNNSQVDNLRHVIYSKALAREIQSVQSPITIGIFSNWGRGKSFLLQSVRGLLNFEQKQDNAQAQRNKVNQNFSSCKIVTMTVLFLSLIVFSVLVILSNISSQMKTLNLVFTTLLLLLLIVLYFIMQSLSKSWFTYSSLKYSWTLIYSIFTKLPINEAEALPIRVASSHKKTVIQQVNEETMKQKAEYESLDVLSNKDSDLHVKKRRYIFVNYNAWKYAGSDVLWAGILMNLADGVEKVLGKLTTRLFRSLNVEKISPEALIHQNEQYLLIKIPLVDGKQMDDIGMDGERMDDRRVDDKPAILQVLSKYGVVKFCQNFSGLAEKFKNIIKPLLDNEKNTWWVVTYSNRTEMRNAYLTLKHHGVTIKLLNNNNEKQITSQCSHFWHHLLWHSKCTCNIPNIYWTFLFVISAILIPVVCSVLLPKNDDVSIAFLIVSLIPIGTAPILVTVKLLWAMCHSQRSRVAKALKGTAENIANELGFMNKVQKEISTMTDLIHAIEFVQNIEYKVVITIDDLDRIPLPKIKAVLESVNILLSERNSPFICLIAIDSRIAVKAFDGDFGQNASGYQYLKKTVSVPFCLPKIDTEDKQRYIMGLIDEADETNEEFDTMTYELSTTSRSSNVWNNINLPSTSTAIASNLDIGFTPNLPENYENNFPTSSTKINFENFLFVCRKYMVENAMLLKYLKANPRNIKRIFNIISVTVSIIRQYQEQYKDEYILRCMAGNCLISCDESDGDKAITDPQYEVLAEDIVLWVVLSEQWPFRVSYILAVIDDANLHCTSGRTDITTDDSDSLFDIYEEIICEIKSSKDSELYKELAKLDGDPEILYGYLKSLKDENRLNKGRVMELLKYTIGLDHSLRQSISHQRDFLGVCLNQTKQQTNSSAT